MEVSVCVPESVWNLQQSWFSYVFFISSASVSVVFWGFISHFIQIFTRRMDSQMAPNEAVAEKPVAEKPKGRKRCVSWFDWVILGWWLMDADVPKNGFDWKWDTLKFSGSLLPLLEWQFGGSVWVFRTPLGWWTPVDNLVFSGLSPPHMTLGSKNHIPEAFHQDLR